MATNIKVAVRVRPFTQRELAARCSCVVAMEGQTTLVRRAAAPHLHGRRSSIWQNSPLKPLAFTYDYSYWSHDPATPNYAAQDAVIHDIAGAILANAREGFNGCLFAYGQTGSGKTHSVFGIDDAPGMVPWTVERVFTEKPRLDADPQKELRIWVSYLELYNDRFHDLLATDENWKGSLNVMDHPKLGVYVQGLTEVPCQSAGDVHGMVTFGNKRRVVAATQLNALSSRSHAVICLRSQYLVGPKPAPGEADDRHVLMAKINFVDLAGSERQAKTGALGSTLTEGRNINRGLSALGMVIKELSDASAKAARGTLKQARGIGHIPFRASKLTFLLKDSLAGNSRTYMLAAISPACTNIEETLSTLRFASSVKTIRTVAVQNRDKKDELIDELRTALEELRAQMSKVQNVDGHAVVHIEEHERLLRAMTSPCEEDRAVSERVKSAHDVILHDMALSKEVLDSAFGVGEGTPYLLNLAEDPVLAGCLLYYLPIGRPVTIGSANANTIRLKGIGITEELCAIQNEDNATLKIQKCGSGGRVVVAGRSLTAGRVQELRHGDRLFLGRAHALKVIVPGQAERAAAAGNAVERPDVDLLFGGLDAALEDECAAIEDSPSWCNLQGHLDQVCRQLPADRARSLVGEVRASIKACDEANEIAAQCRKEDDFCFKVDLTLVAPVAVVICVCKADKPLPLYIWSTDEMVERLERMREYLDMYIHTGRFEEHAFDDPWREVPHDEIMHHVATIQSMLEETLMENLQYKFRQQRARGRAVLAFQKGDANRVLRVTFDAWCQMSTILRKLPQRMRRRSKESRRNAEDNDNPEWTVKASLKSASRESSSPAKDAATPDAERKTSDESVPESSHISGRPSESTQTEWRSRHESNLFGNSVAGTQRTQTPCYATVAQDTSGTHWPPWTHSAALQGSLRSSENVVVCANVNAGVHSRGGFCSDGFLGGSVVRVVSAPPASPLNRSRSPTTRRITHCVDFGSVPTPRGVICSTSTGSSPAPRGVSTVPVPGKMSFASSMPTPRGVFQGDVNALATPRGPPSLGASFPWYPVEPHCNAAKPLASGAAMYPATPPTAPLGVPLDTTARLKRRTLPPSWPQAAPPQVSLELVAATFVEPVIPNTQLSPEHREVVRSRSYSLDARLSTPRAAARPCSGTSSPRMAPVVRHPSAYVDHMLRFASRVEPLAPAQRVVHNREGAGVMSAKTSLPMAKMNSAGGAMAPNTPTRHSARASRSAAVVGVGAAGGGANSTQSAAAWRSPTGHVAKTPLCLKWAQAVGSAGNAVSGAAA